MKKLLLISLTMLISMISKASDYSVDGIGYIIKSVENKTVYVDKITFSGDIVIPDKVQINNYWFTVDSIGNIDNSPESSSLKINGVIKTNGHSLYGYRTACFYVDESNPYMKAEDGILYSKDMKRLISFPSRKRISEFTIPESVSAIDDYSFGDNKYLTRLIFNDNIEDLPENFIYGSDFSGKLKYLKLSDKIKVIHGRCLNYYPTLEEIVLPKDLEEVEKDPHYDYYGLPNELETVTISNSKIANYSYKLEPSTFVFSRFSKLKNLHVDDPNPVALDNNVFTEGKYFTINLYVPAGTKKIYQNTDGWKNFFNIIEESAPQYKLSYIVDGKEYKTYMLDSGVTITPEPAPIKEGYTFSGWSEIPETMPANDVTITGSFTVNSYNLTYMVDNMEYKSFVIDYGTAITPEPAPTKEGYTFSGWSEIPATMPDYDVVVTGTFTKNSEKNNTDEINGHKYVDLGLPSGKCWATTNYGADTPEGYGSYMDWTNNSAISTNWGTDWTTPSVDDILELKDNCTWTWESYNGINGFKVTGKNGNYIFLPASGYKMLGENAAKKVGDWAYYWSSTSANGMAYIIMGTSAEIGYGQMNTSMTYLPIRPITMDSQNSSGDDWTFDGEGTKESPYQIKSPSDLIKLASLTNSGKLTETFYFCMTNNIDMTEIAFTPIGNKNYSFYGNFDGNGFVIKGLTIDSSSEVGLFGYTNGATICNIGIEEADFRSTNYVGGIVGYSSATIIMNCYTQGSISGDFCAGGLVGYGSMLTKIKNCYSSIQHTMTEIQGYVGGLVGYNCGALENCYFSGSINATSYDSSKTGGIMGYYYVLGDVNNCFFIKTSGVNEQLDYYGGCDESYRLGHYDTFDENGITSSGSSLYKLLNTWVTKEQGDYKKWTEEAFPSFVGFNDSSGIAPLPINNSKEITGIYNLQGHKLERLIKGVNIIKYKNGTSKKVVR